jgi:hypothetical protein
MPESQAPRTPRRRVGVYAEPSWAASSVVNQATSAVGE